MKPKIVWSATDLISVNEFSISLINCEAGAARRRRLPRRPRSAARAELGTRVAPACTQTRKRGLSSVTERASAAAERLAFQLPLIAFANECQLAQSGERLIFHAHGGK